MFIGIKGAKKQYGTGEGDDKTVTIKSGDKRIANKTGTQKEIIIKAIPHN